MFLNYWFIVGFLCCFEFCSNLYQFPFIQINFPSNSFFVSLFFSRHFGLCKSEQFSSSDRSSFFFSTSFRTPVHFLCFLPRLMMLATYRYCPSLHSPAFMSLKKYCIDLSNVTFKFRVVCLQKFYNVSSCLLLTSEEFMERSLIYQTLRRFEISLKLCLIWLIFNDVERFTGRISQTLEYTSYRVALVRGRVCVYGVVVQWTKGSSNICELVAPTNCPFVLIMANLEDPVPCGIEAEVHPTPQWREQLVLRVDWSLTVIVGSSQLKLSSLLWMMPAKLLLNCSSHKTLCVWFEARTHAWSRPLMGARYSYGT